MRIRTSKRRNEQPRFTRLQAILGMIAAAVMLALTGCSSDHVSTVQETNQALTDQYMTAAQNAVPYPLAAMTSGGWLERTLLKENLLRQANAHRRAFVTLMNTAGQPIVQFPIQGMVFSLNSQMTTEDIVNNSGCGSNCGWAVTTTAAGDNGTWGPEPDGISFFTTSGMQVKLPAVVWYIETDAPLTLPTKPLVVYDPTKVPDITGGIVGAGKIDVGGKTAKSK